MGLTSGIDVQAVSARLTTNTTMTTLKTSPKESEYDRSIREEWELLIKWMFKDELKKMDWYLNPKKDKLGI